VNFWKIFKISKFYNFDSSIFLKAKRFLDFGFLRTFKELTIIMEELIRNQWFGVGFLTLFLDISKTLLRVKIGFMIF